MDVPLHLQPMTLGDVLDRSFRLYRNHFLRLFLAVLVVQCFAFVLMQIYMNQCIVPFYQLVNVPAGRLPEVRGPLVLQLFVGSVLFVAAYGVLSLLYLAALIHLVHETYLGKPLSLVDAYRKSLRQFWPLLGVNSMKMSILSMGVLFWFAPLMLSLAMQAWWLAGIWLIAGTLPWLFAYLWLALVSIVLVVEQRSPLDSIRRSGQLMFVLTERGLLRTNGFRISIILLVISTVKFIVLMVSQAPYTAWKAYEMFRDPSLLGQYHRTALDSVFDFVNMLMQTAVTPFGLATLVLFYFDIRVRKEGLDLTMRLRSLRERLKSTQLQSA